MGSGYAIIDFETTGFAPGYGHRVIEVGVVMLGADLSYEGHIETLVNPHRDIGPTHIHGISARDVVDAPDFDEIAANLLDAVDGRVIVGHNVSFDLRFLEAEMLRSGFQVPQLVAVDTLELARQLLAAPDRKSFKLPDVANYLNLDADAIFERSGLRGRRLHSALADSLLTAHILIHSVNRTQGNPFWSNVLNRAARVVWPERYSGTPNYKQREEAHAATSRPEASHRQLAAASMSSDRAVPSSSVHDVFRALGHSAGASPATAEYTRTLDGALADRILTSEEIDQLVNTAQRLGLDNATLGSLHRGQFESVVQESWADGVLTEAERDDIVRVGELLGIDPDSIQEALVRGQHLLEEELQAPTSTAASTASDGSLSGVVSLEPGCVVVLTGSMQRERSQVEEELRALGYRIGAAVTKRTSIVVAADPFTESGKAKQARQYGIPVLGEDDGLRLLRSGLASMQA